MTGRDTTYFSWLRWHDRDVFVDSRDYIEAQPVQYDDVEPIIDQIIAQNSPVRAHIDVSRLRITDVYILGFIRIIWDLHEATRGLNLLSEIHIYGASPTIMRLWLTVCYALPDFVRERMFFSTTYSKNDTRANTRV
jgi:hypothetical protein